jgi:hypothetical protein
MKADRNILLPSIISQSESFIQLDFVFICRCGATGMMECDPRECQPEPMLRKMIAAITSR